MPLQWILSFASEVNVLLMNCCLEKLLFLLTVRYFFKKKGGKKNASQRRRCSLAYRGHCLSSCWHGNVAELQHRAVPAVHRRLRSHLWARLSHSPRTHSITCSYLWSCSAVSYGWAVIHVSKLECCCSASTGNSAVGLLGLILVTL